MRFAILCTQQLSSRSVRLRPRDLFQPGLKLFPTFINANSASGFYEPLALAFFFRDFRGFFRKAASFGLAIHCRSLSTSRSISEAFANDTSQGAISAANVIDANCNTGVIAKIKFGQIAVKMLFGTLLINAFHATLEN